MGMQPRGLIFILCGKSIAIFAQSRRSFCLSAKTIRKNALKHRDFCSKQDIFLPFGKNHSQKRVKASRFLLID